MEVKMEKEIIKILTVGKKPESFSLLDLFDEATDKGYDLMIFLPDEEKNYLEIFLLHYDNISYKTCEKLFKVTIKKDDQGRYFSNFEIPEMEEEEFYQILKGKYQVEIKYLSKI
jgi:hypothetical protein